MNQPATQDSNANKTPVVELPLDHIRTDGGTQVRLKTREGTVEEYAEAIRGGANFPPIVVFHDSEAGAYWLADGFHRLEAAQRAGKTVISVDLRPGTQREAILFALEANGVHGLRMTPADRKHAATLLLRDPEWGGWSSREIGRRCGLDGKTVERLRREATAEVPQKRKVARNGKQFEMHTSNIGGNLEPTRAPSAVTVPESLKAAFEVVVVAPPWRKLKAAAVHALQVDSLVEPRGLLFLWAEPDHLADAMAAFQVWQLDCKTVLTWGRDLCQAGETVTGQASHCLVGVRRDWPPCINPGPLLLLEEADDLSRLTTFWELLERECTGRRAAVFTDCEREGWESFGDATGTLSWDKSAAETAV